MAFELVWTAEAENDFRAIVIYLTENWSIQSAESFIHHSYNRLEKLAMMPSVAPPTSKENVRIYKLDRKNAVFFTLENNYYSFKHLPLQKRYQQKQILLIF